MMNDDLWIKKWGNLSDDPTWQKYIDRINEIGCTSFLMQLEDIKENIRMSEEFNTVSKPKHYNREGAMQCIDEMELVFGLEAVKNFCKLNAWKYRYRAADKNGAEDIAKSDWYLNKYKELCERTSSTATFHKVGNSWCVDNSYQD